MLSRLITSCSTSMQSWAGSQCFSLLSLIRSLMWWWQVMYHPTIGHGGFLLANKWRRQILAQVKVVVATGADMSTKAACT